MLECGNIHTETYSKGGNIISIPGLLNCSILLNIEILELLCRDAKEVYTAKFVPRKVNELIASIGIDGSNKLMLTRACFRSDDNGTVIGKLCFSRTSR
eukprot:snap_masked-scaffold_36-processed-gene-2.65-mRNA-1 protein AED:1.00 eAED:1.00 QI:0/0/0/0/1/1/2/0/97